MKLACALALVVVVGIACDKDKGAKVEPPAVKVEPAPPPKTVEPAPPLPDLADNAPKDRPTTGRYTPEQDKRIAELSAESMKKYPDARARFARGLPPGEHMYVTTTLTSPGKTESVFVAVSKIANGKVKGAIASDILNVVGYKSGDAYELPESAITDWMIAKPDGSEEGNLVGKYLDTIH